VGQDGVALDLAVGTEFPLSVGGEATLELPGRLLAQMHVGWLPSAYVRTLNGLATKAGWYGQQTASVIESTIDGAYVLRPAVGWRPVASSGFEIWAGYTHVRLDGGTSPRELEEAGVVDEMPGGSRRIPVHGRLHAVQALIGWSFLPTEDVVLRAGIGYTKVLGADVKVKSSSAAANRRASRELEDAVTDYVQSVELQLTAGFRL
jgi:hypothetical protein